VIYDRHGKILAENRPIIYEQCDIDAQTCEILSHEEALEYEARGEQVVQVAGRDYRAGPWAAHVVGYMTEINAEQLTAENERIRDEWGLQPEQFCYQCYGLGDFIGVAGIEASFESQLRGTPGKRLVEVDAQGNEVRELARVEPTPGENITLSIDIQLQQAAARSLEDMRREETVLSPGGTVIATDPDTGEIRVLYSSPTYDPNVFVYNAGEETGIYDFPYALAQNRGEILTDEEKPLFNRALTGRYPPASTFKLVTATAALEEGAITAHTEVEDTGVIHIGPYSYKNWYFTQHGRTEGSIDVVRALARSNDIFFYKAGEWLGVSALEKWTTSFKMTDVLDIEISGETAGLLRRDRDWYTGDTYHVSIGQGDALATPLHVQAINQIMADDGTYCPMTLINRKNNSPRVVSSKPCESLDIAASTVQLVQQGMVEACSTGGTAWPLFNFQVDNQQPASPDASQGGPTTIQLACKTGTAQFGHPEDFTHAWLTGYGPVDDPEIAVTVLVEEGGEGSSVAGPVAKEVFDEWFMKTL
jgi:penicillin-binding protein 2